MRRCTAAMAMALGLAAQARAAEPPLAAGARYVALGSSFAAGPAITQQAEGGVTQCRQSRDNYARQLARARGLTLVDVSCGGATTEHILKGGQFGQPAQLDAVTPQTRLVTVTIGGNDVRFTADLGVWSCANAGARRLDPTAPCPQPAAFDRDAAFTALGGSLRAIAAEVRRRAPQARLVFVDYVAIIPPAGGACAAVALTPQQADQARAIAARLAALTEQVARDSGAGIVKASQLTRGHEACSKDAWAWGYEFPSAEPFGSAPYHPRLPAHTAVARALDAMLQR